MNFYKTARWEKARAAALRRDGYQCQLSKRYGKQTAAEVVHHIFPLKDFPEHALKQWNLISLSISAHNSLHDRNTDELTAAGVDLLRRTARANKIDIPERYLNERMERRLSQNAGHVRMQSLYG